MKTLSIVGFFIVLSFAGAYPVPTETRPLQALKADDELLKDPKINRFLVPEKYRDWLWKYAAETGIPLDVATRLPWEESWWKPQAKNYNTSNNTIDRGLFQLNSRNLGWFAGCFNDHQKVDPHDPETAIRVGLRYLAFLYRKYGSLREALAQYNGGAPSSYEFAARILKGA